MNESLLSRGMPIILSCLLHAGLATALILFGQQWITAALSARPPVLPVELVVLDAPDEPRSDAARPAVPPAHEAIRPPKRPAAPRANATPAAIRAEEPSAPEPAPRMAVDPAGRAVVVWEESTAVRRRILLRYTADAGRTLSPIHVLSGAGALKAYAPDIAFAPDGSFLVAWHEERFPFLVTVVLLVRIPGAR